MIYHNFGLPGADNPGLKGEEEMSYKCDSCSTVVGVNDLSDYIHLRLCSPCLVDFVNALMDRAGLFVKSGSLDFHLPSAVRLVYDPSLEAGLYD